MDKKSSKLIIYYFLGAVAITGFIILGSLLDSHFGLTNVCQTLAKLIVFEICILFIRSKNLKYTIGFNFKNFFTPYLLLGLIPIFITLFMYYGPLNKPFDLSIIIIQYISIAASILWGETYFRGIGVYLFQTEPIKRTIILLTVTAGIVSFMTAILTNPFEIALLKSISSMALGYFLLALYLKTNNILVPISIHFCIHCSEIMFAILSTNPVSFGESSFYILYLIEIIVLPIIGTLVLKKRSN